MITKKFGQYTVTLDPAMDGGDTTGCWIEFGDFSASLEAADSTGVLVDSNDRERSVPRGTIAAIREWAETNGY